MVEAGRRTRRSYAGYIPFAAVGVGGGAGGWLASLVELPQWSLAIPCMVAGYFVSGAILRRYYASGEGQGSVPE